MSFHRWVQDWEQLVHAMVEESYLPARLDPCTGALQRFLEVGAEPARA